MPGRPGAPAQSVRFRHRGPRPEEKSAPWVIIMPLLSQILCFFPESLWKPPMFFRAGCTKFRWVWRFPGRVSAGNWGCRGRRGRAGSGLEFHFGSRRKHWASWAGWQGRDVKATVWSPRDAASPLSPKPLFIYQIDLCRLPHSCDMLGFIKCLKIKAYPAVKRSKR